MLRDRYSDDYPPVRDQLTRIHTIETEAVPRVVAGILAELRAKEQELQGRVDSASTELAAIPPRTIEEARLRRQVDIQEKLYNELRQRVETARLASASSIPDITSSIERRSRTVRATSAPSAGRHGSLGYWRRGGAGHPPRPDRPAHPVPEAESAARSGLDILGSIPRIRARARGGAERRARARGLQGAKAHTWVRVRLGGPAHARDHEPRAGRGQVAHLHEPGGGLSPRWGAARS